MSKESKRKIKPKSSSPKYVSSDKEVDSSDDDDDESLLSDMSKNPTKRIKGLLTQFGLQDELLEEQENWLFKRKRVIKNSRSS
jgi:hypothetical protein